MAEWKLLAGAGALALTAASYAFAQNADVAAWDLDADGALNVEEFRGGLFARLNVADWDVNADGHLDMNEFFGGVYTRYDVDRTEAIDGAEYDFLDEDFGEHGRWTNEEVADTAELGAAVGSEGLVADAGVAGEGMERVDLETWDIDGDGVIVRDEFEDGFDDWGAFAEFDEDLDGLISEDELAEGVFSLYDEDDDGLIEEPELVEIGDDMGVAGFWDN